MDKKEIIKSRLFELEKLQLELYGKDFCSPGKIVWII